MFRWRRGNTRGACIVVPCGCLASLPFLSLGLVAARVFVSRRAPAPGRWVYAGARCLAGFGEKGS